MIDYVVTFLFGMVSGFCLVLAFILFYLIRGGEVFLSDLSRKKEKVYRRNKYDR